MTKTAEKKRRPLSWKAKRSPDGKVYCAPACGRGCKWKEYQRAKRLAEALAKRLGSGWMPRIFENLGWHYEVRTNDGTECGHIQLTEHWRRPETNGLVDRIGALHPDHYTAFLSREGSIGGHWTADAETPEEAVRDVLAKAIEQRDQINKIIDTMLRRVARATDLVPVQ